MFLISQTVYKKEILKKFFVYLIFFFIYRCHFNEKHRRKLVIMLSDLLYNLKIQKARGEFQDMEIVYEP